MVSDMPMDLIDFECSKCRDGYRIVTKRTRTSRYPPYLVAQSDRFERYRPLDHFPALFDIFARAPSTAEGLCDFADKFGLPGSSTESNTKEQQLLDIRKAQADMRQALSDFKSGEHQKLIKLLRERNSAAIKHGPLVMPGSSGLTHFELRSGANGRLETVILPSTLIQAMWVQFTLYAASGARLFRCEQCSKPFVVGSGTKRRSTAKYCCNACKVAAFKARQEA